MKRIVLIVFLTVSLALQAQVRLGYDLEVGTVFKIEQTAKQVITQKIGDAGQVVENDIWGLLEFEVVDVNDDGIKMTMVFKALKMLTSSPSLGELMNMDSTSEDETDVFSNMMKAIIDVPVTVVMKKTGEIESVKGGDELIDQMLIKMGIDDANTSKSVRDQMGGQFGSKAMANNFQQMTYFFPVEEVSVNGGWTNTFQGDLTAENSWVLKEHSSDHFKITGEATMKMYSKEENLEMDLEGTQSTTISGDSKSGLFIEILVTNEAEGHMSMTGQDMEIPMTLTSTLTYKRI